MNSYTNLNGREDLLESICALEKELAAKTGKEVALVAYSPVKYAELSEDAEALAKITELDRQECCPGRFQHLMPLHILRRYPRRTVPKAPFTQGSLFSIVNHGTAPPAKAGGV